MILSPASQRFTIQEKIKIAERLNEIGVDIIEAGMPVVSKGDYEACRTISKLNLDHSEVIGLEWDPSHLICMFIDPVANLRKFGKRVYHVHAKDAHVNRDLLSQYGIWHPGVIEHCFAGFGDTDWNLCIKELLRQGYQGDLNIEGWHDSVYRDTENRKLEDTGLILSFKYLSQFVVQD